MAGSSLLALLDDIATILDDVALMTKVAAKKTTGVLGDDLALNAQQAVGLTADRELPVVWRVAKGSAINKLILVPAALVLSAFAPWAVLPLLMIGGAFLCYEGFEKVAHKLLHRKQEDEAQHDALATAVADPAVDMVHFEKDKIRGAIRTDFILSAEIVIISLGTVAHKPIDTRIGVLCAIGVVMTVGVYGLVAGIVKLDDLGVALSNRSASSLRAIGRAILTGAPYLMKLLAIAGTVAMFLVGGGIVVHGIAPVHHFVDSLGTGVVATVLSFGANGIAGVATGGIVLGVVALAKRLL